MKKNWTSERPAAAPPTDAPTTLSLELDKLSQRYDTAIGMLHHVRAEAAQLRQQSAALRSQSAQINTDVQILRERITHKQAAITVLLPHYPHPLTPELRYQIEC